MKIKLTSLFVIVFAFIFSQSNLYAQIQEGSFNFDGNPRSYKVFLPNDYTDTVNFPLVIYLHSYGWSNSEGMAYTLLHEVADTSGFIVAFPKAFPNWNSGIGDNPNWPTPDVDDVGFINALIDTLSNHYSINLERVYACGYSNGGFMAHKLARVLSNRIAGIASVGGVISTSTADYRGTMRTNTMPILQIHGTDDGWVSMGGAIGWYSVDETLNYWNNFNNCVESDTTILPDLDKTDGCTVEKISYANCSNVIYYKVIGGGHTWPGAGPPGYNAGNTNHDIHASTLILNFFKNYENPTVGINKTESTSNKFELSQNYPNPFNPSTTIRYRLENDRYVIVKIYDIVGKLISTLTNNNQTQGWHSVIWNGTYQNGEQAPAELYFSKLTSGNEEKTTKLMLLK